MKWPLFPAWKAQATVTEGRMGQGHFPSAALHPKGGSWLHISLSCFSPVIKREEISGCGDQTYLGTIILISKNFQLSPEGSI